MTSQWDTLIRQINEAIQCVQQELEQLRQRKPKTLPHTNKTTPRKHTQETQITRQQTLDRIQTAIWGFDEATQNNSISTHSFEIELQENAIPYIRALLEEIHRLRAEHQEHPNTRTIHTAEEGDQQ